MRLRPVRLRPDNFTPPTRTPWGGTRLLARFKRGLGIASVDAKTAVGESWEFSNGEEFHSLTEDGERIGDVLQRAPQAFLGAEAERGQHASALLVKWLDAADDLSLQIHPHDDYEALAAGDAGKLESWYVVDRDEGAGIYFGFAAGAGEREVQHALETGADLRDSMRFVRVERGDFILLEPGTPHAVGKGINLIEPQTVKPGHRGLTYRYWDFNRRYDASGKLDANGTARALHVREALAVTRWERASDAAWLDSRRVACGWPDPAAPARCEGLCGARGEARLESDRLRVARLCGSGALRLPAWNSLRALTLVEGEIVLGAGADAMTVRSGSTVVIPAELGALELKLDRAHAILSAVGGREAG